MVVGMETRLAVGDERPLLAGHSEALEQEEGGRDELFGEALRERLCLDLGHEESVAPIPLYVYIVEIINGRGD